jgi:hypothetical protein
MSSYHNLNVNESGEYVEDSDATIDDETIAQDLPSEVITVEDQTTTVTTSPIRPLHDEEEASTSAPSPKKAKMSNVESEDETVVCTICFLSFTNFYDYKHTPCCTHPVHGSCLLNYLEHKNENELHELSSLPCHLCRRIITLTPHEIYSKTCFHPHLKIERSSYETFYQETHRKEHDKFSNIFQFI